MRNTTYVNLLVDLGSSKCTTLLCHLKPSLGTIFFHQTIWVILIWICLQSFVPANRITVFPCLKRYFINFLVFSCPTVYLGPFFEGTTSLILYLSILLINEGHPKPRNEVESLRLAKHSVGIESKTFQFSWWRLSRLYWETCLSQYIHLIWILWPTIYQRKIATKIPGMKFHLTVYLVKAALHLFTPQTILNENLTSDFYLIPNKSISCHWSLSIPHENTRKPLLYVHWITKLHSRCCSAILWCK